MDKIKNLKTSELLDTLDIESRKKEPNDDLIGNIETEIDSRDPFKYIESRIEGSEDENGLRKDVEELEKEIEELKRLLRKHDHKDGKVVVKL